MYHSKTKLDIPRFDGAIKSVVFFTKIIYADDGMLMYKWHNSTEGIVKSYFNSIIETTEEVADFMGYIDPDFDETDTNNYIFNMSPTLFIFMAIFCIITSGLSLTVLLICKCVVMKNKKKYYSKKQMIDTDNEKTDPDENESVNEYSKE